MSGGRSRTAEGECQLATRLIDAPKLYQSRFFMDFTPEIRRCIWLPPVIALKLFDYYWGRANPNSTKNHRQAAHYTTQQMAT